MEPKGQKFIDTFIKIALLAVLIYACLAILKPFLSVIVWSSIIAISLAPLHARLTKKLNEKPKLSAIIITAVIILVFLVPSFFLTESMIHGVKEITNLINADKLHVPPADPDVKKIPFVGEDVHDYWVQASEDPPAFFHHFNKQILSFIAWIGQTAAGAGIGFLMFLLSVFIAGIMLIYEKELEYNLVLTFKRLLPDKGEKIALDSAQTVRNVAKGILGVALIQSLLAGVIMLVGGVPMAGLWTLLCVFFAIIQIGLGPVLIPVIIYCWSTMPPGKALVLTIFLILVTLVDNVLKPILLGKGAPVPMLVVFLGAIGGFIAFGLIGLFIGAVILSLGYRLFSNWVEGTKEVAS